MNKYGYAGKQLRVNLSDKEIELDERYLKESLGGVGYAAKLLYDEIPGGIDPLSPQNKLIFATGPLTGTTAPGSGSIEVCFKSPLTGIWGESRAGSDFGKNLKKAGYDFLIVEGKSDEPVYIAINDERVYLKPAFSLAGKTTSQKDKIVKDELKNDKYEVATIGPAGENLVRFSNIMIGDRACGRCGGGAVMSSKNLLAVAVKGTKDIPIYDKEGFIKASKEASQKVLNTTGKEGMSQNGTTGDIPACDYLGDFPTKNWRSNSWGKGEELYDHFKNENLVGAAPCYKGCILRCERVIRVKDGKWKTPMHGGGEYESITAFTSFVLNDDVDAAVHATYLCNELGIDTISAGGVIAFAMDCYENGMIKKEETDGLDLSWGNAETIVELVKRISHREGWLGKVLSLGVREASKVIGQGSEALAIHVKGLEGAAHDPRSGKMLALTYGTSNLGMCHIHPIEGMAYDSLKNDFGLIPYGIPDPKTLDRWDEEGKGKIAPLLEHFGILADVLGICKFYLYNGLHLDSLSSLMTTLTGESVTERDLLDVGKKVYNTQRMFNVREGIRKEDDLLPKRAISLPEFGRYASIEKCEIKNYEAMLEECYQSRGWNQAGIPETEN